MPAPVVGARSKAWNMESTIRQADRVRRECNSRLHPRNMEAEAAGRARQLGEPRTAQTKRPFLLARVVYC